MRSPGYARSCIIDGEAVACDDNGVASFDLVRHQRANDKIFLYAFDLIGLNGDDLRRDPLEVRKATLRSILAKAGLGLRFNEQSPLTRISTICREYSENKSREKHHEFRIQIRN